MEKILHTIWQINYNRRTPKEPVTLVINYVGAYNQIAGEICYGDHKLLFSTKNECLHLLNTRFEKGILV